jgi:RES domain-containing protein
LNGLDIYEAVDSLGSVPFSGLVYRHISPRWTCTSGAGAREAGARRNPPDSFPVIYTALSERTLIAEFYRFAGRSSLPPANLLPRRLCVLQVDLRVVLDLRSTDALAAVGLTAADLESDDWSACQQVGDAAHKLEFEGLLAPSATGTGDVLAIFELHLRPQSVVREVDHKLWAELPLMEDI